MYVCRNALITRTSSRPFVSLSRSFERRRDVHRVAACPRFNWVTHSAASCEIKQPRGIVIGIERQTPSRFNVFRRTLDSYLARKAGKRSIWKILFKLESFCHSKLSNAWAIRYYILFIYTFTDHQTWSNVKWVCDIALYTICVLNHRAFINNLCIFLKSLCNFLHCKCKFLHFWIVFIFSTHLFILFCRLSII